MRLLRMALSLVTGESKIFFLLPQPAWFRPSAHHAFACTGVIPAFSASSCCPTLRLTLAPRAVCPRFLSHPFPVLRVPSRSQGLAAVLHPVLVGSRSAGPFSFWPVGRVRCGSLPFVKLIMYDSTEYGKKNLLKYIYEV